MVGTNSVLLTSVFFTWTSAGLIPRDSNTKRADTTSTLDPLTGLLGGTVQQTVLKLPVPGPVALAQAYAKHGSSSSRKRDAAPQLGSSIPVNPTGYDAEYLCTVSVGGQSMDLDLDTGSSDLWVFSSDLPASSQTGHDIYTASKSSTAKRITGANWSVGYGDGSSASGSAVYNDTVTLGRLSVLAQAVEAANFVSDDLASDASCDGIMGLGFQNLNSITPKSRANPVTTAFQQKSLSSNLFTADLKKGKPGTYDFGFINSTKYTGSITYNAVDSSQGYWGFTANGWGVGSTYSALQMAGIADTGTSLLVLPDAVVNGYWGKVPGSVYDDNYGAYTYPCSATLPTFTLGVGSAKYTLPGPYLNYGPISATMCYGGLQSSNGLQFNIFGAVFLKGVFVVFDQSVPRIGFATKNL